MDTYKYSRPLINCNGTDTGDIQPLVGSIIQGRRH